MERTIDRREYRRNVENTKITKEEQGIIWQKRIRIFLLQGLGMSIVLLTISFLKFFHCQDILYSFKDMLCREITVSSLKNDGQRMFKKATQYYVALNSWVEKTFYDENGDVIPTFFNKNSGNSNGENKMNSDNKLNNTNTSENIYNAIGSGEVINGGNTFSNEKLNAVGGNNSVTNGTLNAAGGNNLATNVGLSTANGEAGNYEIAVEGMNQMLEDAKKIKEKYNMIVPVIGTITSEFGVRESTNPIVSPYHSGLDIAANTGTQILAALDGTVLEATTDTYYGKYLKVQKDDLIMIYAHCSKLLVEAGDEIKKGDLIAYVGNTGNSTGPHLHFELRYQERLVNPKDILEI